MKSSTSVTLDKRARMPVFIGLSLVAVTILYPLFFIMTVSLRTNVDYQHSQFGLPIHPTLDNFRVLINQLHIGRAFLNSIFVISIALSTQLLLASLAAFGMAKFNPPFARFINGSLVSVMLIPGQVLIIPTYVMLSKLHLVGHYAGLILVYIVTGLPFAIFFLTLSFRGLPNETFEAARLDGAGFVRMFRSLVVPMSISSIAALSVLQFLGMWNEFLFAKVLISDRSNGLLTPTLALLGGRYQNNQPLISSGLFISGVVPIILLSFASKYIMQGLSVGRSR